MRYGIVKTLLACAAVAYGCFSAYCAEFTGKLYWAASYNDTGYEIYSTHLDEWNSGESRFEECRFDEYMKVNGVKYPQRDYSANFKEFFLIEVKLDKVGEKFTPVVVNGTTTPGEVSVSVMTDSEVYKTFSNTKLDWMAWWLRNIFPDGVSNRRAWIKIIPGQSKTTLRAQVDLSERPAAGIYSDRSMSALAKECGVNYFTGTFPIAPSTWYSIGIKETGEIFVPTAVGLDSPRLYIGQLGYSKEFISRFVRKLDEMEEKMGESRCEAVICQAAWYVSAQDAGGAELVVWPENVQMGTVSGNGVYKPGTKVTLKATANQGFVFAGWYDANSNPLSGGSTDYRTATYPYVTTGADVTLTAKFATVEEDIASLQVHVNDLATDEDGLFMLDLGKCVDSITPPKLTVSGLPAGLKYDAKTMMITGKVTKPGVYIVKVAATNTSVKKGMEASTAEFAISVPNLKDNLIKVDDTYGPYVPGVSYTADLPAATGCSVSGLPSGMKWSANDARVSGIPTTPGKYTVTFTKTIKVGKVNEKHVATSTFVVGPFPKLSVDVVGNGTGNVTGAGAYAVNKKVALKATPDKNSAFMGWYDGAALISRDVGCSYVMPETDKILTANFATKAEDVASLIVAVVDDTTEADGSYALDLGACVESWSQPKLTVTGLPTGLKYDAKTMMIAGKATTPGVYTVAVKATNASATGKDAKTATFKITVPNLSCAALPKLLPGADAYDIVRAGIMFNPRLVDCTPAPGWTVKVSGLPSGLKYDARTGAITGVPTAKAGSYTVTFTASKKGEPNQVATITLNVYPLPDWTVGTFYGLVNCYGDDGSWENTSAAEITISSNGKVTVCSRETNNYLWKDVTSLYVNDSGVYCFDVLHEKGVEWWQQHCEIYAEPAWEGGPLLGRIVGEEEGVDWDEDAYVSDWIAIQDAYGAKPAGLPLPKFNSADAISKFNVNAASDRFHWRKENGSLVLKFGANGVVTPTWSGDAKFKMLAAHLTPYSVDGEGAVSAKLLVQGVDRAKERSMGLYCDLVIPCDAEGNAYASEVQFNLEAVIMDDL